MAYLKSESNCTSQISSKNDINKVYKTCSHPVADCKDCKERLAIKIFKYSSNEGKILKEIHDNLPLLPEQFENYADQIISFRDFTTRQNTEVLVTSLVETGPNKTMNFKQFLESGLPLSGDAFDSIILQVILTLRIITKLLAKNFVHVDLLVKQIFLKPSEPTKTLWVSNKYYVKMPSAYTAVMGDFGHSITEKHPKNFVGPLHSQIKGIGQDLFRFFWNLFDIAESKRLPKLKAKVLQWTNKVFSGHFNQLLHLQETFRNNQIENTYGYLPRSAQKYLPSDFTFLDNCEFYRNYLVKLT